MSSELETSLNKKIRDSSIRCAAHGMKNDSFLLNGCHRHCGNALAAPDESELFICRSFDAQIRFATIDGGGNFLPHRGNVRRDLRFFSDNSCIDVEHAGFLFGKQFTHLLQNLDAANPANRLVRVWEMLTNIAGADRAQ